MNKKIISLLISLILTFFICIKFNISQLMSIIVFGISYFIINYLCNRINKKYNKVSIILSIVLSIIYVICDGIEKTYSFSFINRYFLLNIISYFIIFYLLINNLFTLIDKYKSSENEERKIYIGKKEIFTTSKFSFFVNFILIFVVELLFLIKFYPGILTYDSYNEIMQVKGIIHLMNNHSILHTGILALFIKFGMLFKSINIGVFLYSLFQISLVSLLFSYVLHLMSKHKVPIIIRIISLMFFAFHPINIFYSISLWKDIFFSLSFALFSIIIYYYSNNKDYFKSKKNIILFIIISLLVMYLRNNGVYVVIITLIILFIMNRSNYKKLLPIFLSIIFVFFISKFIIFNALNINDFEIGETLSFPSQSISRIYKCDKDKLSKKEIKQIENFYSNKIGDVYNPIIADNTKGLLNKKFFNKHKLDYIGLNVKLFFKHSNRYLESFISNNYGYYYMNTYYPSIILDKVDQLGIKHSNIDTIFIFLFLVLIVTIIFLIILWNLREKKNILLFGLLVPVLLSIPFSLKDNSFVSVFFNVGFYCTVLVLLIIYNIKNKNRIEYYIPSIILWVSLFLSPVYSEFRYIYPIFILVPFFIGITMKKTDD